MPYSIFGYDADDELRIEIAIDAPDKNIVRFDDDDPDGVGCYSLTVEEAAKLAKVPSLSGDLDYFLEYTG